MKVAGGGTMPGDPLADVALCFAVSCLLSQLCREMEAAGFRVMLPHPPGGIFASDSLPATVAHDEVELLPPTYVDDTAFHWEEDSPPGLLARLAEAAVLLRRPPDLLFVRSTVRMARSRRSSPFTVRDPVRPKSFSPVWSRPWTAGRFVTFCRLRVAGS
jgi:hypothetical protein